MQPGVGILPCNCTLCCCTSASLFVKIAFDLLKTFRLSKRNQNWSQNGMDASPRLLQGPIKCFLFSINYWNQLQMNEYSSHLVLFYLPFQQRDNLSPNMQLTLTCEFFRCINDRWSLSSFPLQKTKHDPNKLNQELHHVAFYPSVLDHVIAIYIVVYF